MPKQYHNQLPNFVPPDPLPPRVEIVSHADLPAAPISAPMPHASHLDRSRGFVLVTAPLAAATGVVVLLLGGLGLIICRELTCWYFRLTELSTKLDTTNKTLADIRHVLAQPRQIP